MRKLTAGLLGAAAVAVSLVMIRQPRPESQPTGQPDTPAGEKSPGEISLDRLRELGY